MKPPRYSLALPLPCGHEEMLWPFLQAFHAGTLAGADERRLAQLLEECPDCDVLWAFDTAFTELQLLTPSVPSLLDSMARLHDQFLQGLTGQRVVLDFLAARSQSASDGEQAVRLIEERTHSPQGEVAALAFLDASDLWALEPAAGQIESFKPGSRVGSPLGITLAASPHFALDEAGMCAWQGDGCIEARHGSGDTMFRITSPPFPEPGFQPAALALDTPLIAVGGADGRLLLWKIGEADWHELAPSGTAAVTCLEVRQQRVAWGDAAGVCRVLDLATESVVELPLSGQPLSALALGEGERLAAALPDALVLIRGDQAATLPVRSAGVTALAFHATEPLLAAAIAGNGTGKPKLSLFRLQQ